MNDLKKLDSNFWALSKRQKNVLVEKSAHNMEINPFFLTVEGKILNVSKNKPAKAESHTFVHCKNKKIVPNEKRIRVFGMSNINMRRTKN